MLATISRFFKQELSENLTGIYLHGSLAMGCFNPKKSDIDLIIVVKNPLSLTCKKRIVNGVLILHDQLRNQGGLELSIVLEAVIYDFIYPTPFELHFSAAHVEKYRSDETYVCSGQGDPDLAAHFFVIYNRGVVLTGPTVQRLFKSIDQKFYLESILNDVEEAVTEIVRAPVYYVLNLCRTLYFLKEGFVASKKEGGEWGLQALPSCYSRLIQQCLDQYHSLGEEVAFNDDELQSFAQFMLARMRSIRVKH